MPGLPLFFELPFLLTTNYFKQFGHYPCEFEFLLKLMEVTPFITRNYKSINKRLNCLLRLFDHSE